MNQLHNQEVLLRSLDPSQVRQGPPRQGRFTVTEVMTYLAPDQTQPTVAESRFGGLATSDERAYQRTVKVGEEWQALDLGWVKECGCSQLLIENATPQWTVMPTDKQRGEADAKVIEIKGASSAEAEWEILPGQSHRGRPALGAHALLLRCRAGTASVRLTACPL